MRAVIQRVTEAAVSVNDAETGRIGPGLLVLLGVEQGDADADFAYIRDKTPNLRIFEDEQGKMNRSLLDVGGALLCVSQFTLLGDARGQNRPGFTSAEAPERANELFERLCAMMRDMGVPVETGRFRTHMTVSLVNDGPVTILLDSKKTF